MKNPDPDDRRAIIREWMTLPKDKRRSIEQGLLVRDPSGTTACSKDPGDASTRVAECVLPRLARD